MKVEVTPKEKPQVDFKYPGLYQSKERGYVALFTSPGVGVVLTTEGTDVYQVGELQPNFSMSYFRPFYGEVTISNGEEDE